MRGRTRSVFSLLFALLISLAGQEQVLAVNGTWTNTAGGDYDTASNWALNQIASGAGFTADFSTLDIPGDVIVQKDTPLTIGNFKFGDTNTGTGGAWQLTTAAASVITLDNSGSTPNITVNPLVPVSLADDALINLGIASALGFNKLGNGVLTLAGANPDLHGTVSVNTGTLRLASTATFDYETVTTPERTQFHLANGTILEAQAQVGDVAAAGAGVSVAASGTATIRRLSAGSIANVGGTGPGATLNVESPGLVTTVDQNWANTNALGTLNFIGTQSGTPSVYNMRFVGGGFNGGSFGSTAVNLTNATLSVNSNSGGNVIPMGSLAGDGVSTVQGGTGGTVVTYEIGSLNSNTTYAGATATNNGFNLNKVGSAKLTLSGTLGHTTTNNALPDLRGGITRITSGTLALAGPAAIPGGITDGTLGDLFTTIDLKEGATLDVSGTASTYGTAALQQLIGGGTVAGNYNHSQGRLRPGDVPFGNENTATSAQGTLTFTGNLNVSGGTINYDIAPTTGDYNSNGVVDTADYSVWKENNGTSNPLPNRDPANVGAISSADYNSWKANFGTVRERIQVNGGALSGNTVVDVGILPGATSGTYTIINSTTPLTGTIAGWTVNWTGRGATPTLTQTANQVQLNAGALVPPAILNWRGNVDAVWNAGAGGTPNWHNTGTNAADNFFTRDTVRFLDTYDGVNPPTTTTITLNQVVSPGAVVVNSTADYTIAGTGRISGAASFVKQGTGRLTITTNNDFSGGSTISSGIVSLGGTGVLGSRPITLSGGELHCGNAGNFNLNNDLVIVGSGNVLSNDNAAAQTLNVNRRVSGTGTLQLQNNISAVVNGIDLFADNTGFSGSIVFNGPRGVFLRFRNSAAAAGTNVAWDIGNNGSTLSQRIDVATPTTFVLGSLSGGTSSGVSGFGSGANPGAQSIWQIGSLNTSTEFAGVISNGNTGSNPAKTSAVTKVGTGTLTLSGINTYTGDTRVQGGVLRTTNATVLGDSTALFLSAGTTVNLDFDAVALGSDTIRGLVIPSTTQQIGLWGRVGNAGAQFTSPFLTGDGLLNVTAIIPAGSGVGTAVIPEPATGLMMVVVAGIFATRRSRRHG